MTRCALSHARSEIRDPRNLGCALYECTQTIRHDLDLAAETNLTLTGSLLDRLWSSEHMGGVDGAVAGCPERLCVLSEEDDMRFTRGGLAIGSGLDEVEHLLRVVPPHPAHRDRVAKPGREFVPTLPQCEGSISIGIGRRPVRTRTDKIEMPVTKSCVVLEDVATYSPRVRWEVAKMQIARQSPRRASDGRPMDRDGAGVSLPIRVVRAIRVIGPRDACHRPDRSCCLRSRCSRWPNHPSHSRLPPGLSVPSFDALSRPAPSPGLVPSPRPERLSSEFESSGEA
jgi:hypothetical protein